MPTVDKAKEEYLEEVDQAILQDIPELQERQNLFEKYADTPLGEIPPDDLLIMLSDTPLEEVSEEIQEYLGPAIQQAIAKEAEARGPLTEKETTQFVDRSTFRPTMSLKPGYLGQVPTRSNTAYRIGVEQGFKDFGRMIPGLNKLDFYKKNTLSEEIEDRIELEREGASSEYYRGLVTGSLVDPIGGGVAAGSLKLGNVALRPFVAEKTISPVTGMLASSGFAGTVQGAMIPTYEPLGDSRAVNTMFGTALGVGIPATAVAGAKGLEKVVDAASMIGPARIESSRPLGGKLAPQPVPQTLAGGRVQPKETPVQGTGDYSFSVSLNTPPVSSKLDEIDSQIAVLRAADSRATNNQQKLRTRSSIKRLEQAKVKEEKRLAEEAQSIDQNLILIENRMERLTNRIDELSPDQKGANARIRRAERAYNNLELDYALIQSLDYSNKGGYTITVNGNLYNDPSQVAFLKNRMRLNHDGLSNLDVVMPPPKKTGDDYEDLVNEVNYVLNSDDIDMRIGFEAPPTLSAAGVRPGRQYADETGIDDLRTELAQGTEAPEMLEAGTMSPPVARKLADQETSADTGRRQKATKEERGRRVGLEEALDNQGKRIMAKQMGYEDEDLDWAVENVVNEFDGKATIANMAEAARLLKRGLISRDYDTLVDFAMDQNRILTAQEMRALQNLFIEAENIVDKSLRKLQRLTNEGRLDSPEAVEVLEDLALAGYMNTLRRKTGSAASHILTEAKRLKKVTAENTKRLKTGELITSLLGVEC